MLGPSHQAVLAHIRQNPNKDEVLRGYCRAWIDNTLRELENEGYIKMGDNNKIEVINGEEG